MFESHRRNETCVTRNRMFPNPESKKLTQENQKYLDNLFLNKNQDQILLLLKQILGENNFILSIIDEKTRSSESPIANLNNSQQLSLNYEIKITIKNGTCIQYTFLNLNTKEVITNISQIKNDSNI
jgi:hypothetical protein